MIGNASKQNKQINKKQPKTLNTKTYYLLWAVILDKLTRSAFQEVSIEGGVCGGNDGDEEQPTSKSQNTFRGRGNTEEPEVKVCTFNTRSRIRGERFIQSEVVTLQFMELCCSPYMKASFGIKS